MDRNERKGLKPIQSDWPAAAPSVWPADLPLVPSPLRASPDLPAGPPGAAQRGRAGRRSSGAVRRVGPRESRAREWSRQAAAGRHLRVIYVRDPDADSVFVITAYELRGKPLQAYRRRRRVIPRAESQDPGRQAVTSHADAGSRTRPAIPPSNN